MKWTDVYAPKRGPQEEIRKVFVNQSWRDADQVAKIDDQVLIEYEMPAGSTSLRVYQGNTFRTISYKNIPQKWIKELHKNEVELIACPQQMYHKTWDKFSKELNENIRMLRTNSDLSVQPGS